MCEGWLDAGKKEREERREEMRRGEKRRGEEREVDERARMEAIIICEARSGGSGSGGITLTVPSVRPKTSSLGCSRGHVMQVTPAFDWRNLLQMLFFSPHSVPSL
jgi:hypothetical protein